MEGKAPIQKMSGDSVMQNKLTGRGPEQSDADVLNQIAEYLGAAKGFDTYGEGAYLQAFEAEVAASFDKEAAVFMPSGTMAQQIALRIWCDQNNNANIAMHPSSHLEFAELLGYQHLHHLRRLQFGVPELVGTRLLTIDDFKNLHTRPGAILLELPCRPLGGMLHPWDELKAISDWARANKIPIHLDGARIWQCRPFYQKSFAEIAALFDSIYVSFYKDLGAMFGCMLLGTESFIQESKVWQRRHGGNLINQGPAVVSAKMGFEQVLPQIDNWVDSAKRLAQAFNNIEGVRTNPVVPQSSMFQLFIEGDAAQLNQRHEKLAQDTWASLFRKLSPSGIPGIATTEVHVFENAANFDVGLIASLMAVLLTDK
jgi:threonine aldolase